ncbi:hypothetical protein ACFL5G_02510 [Candidatus Margulisiibacteriota bacterium]
MSNKKETENFGLLLSVILLLLSHYFGYKNHDIAARRILIAGITVFLIYIIKPGLIVYIQKPWLAIANVISTIVTSVILTVIYYVFFVPYAMLLKLFKVRFFKQFHAATDSFWIDKKPPKDVSGKAKIKYYERQF